MATLLPGHPCCRVVRNGFVNNKPLQWHFCQVLFLNNYCFFFKTSGYNVECAGLWDQSNGSLQNIRWVFFIS